MNVMLKLRLKYLLITEMLFHKIFNLFFMIVIIKKLTWNIIIFVFLKELHC